MINQLTTNVNHEMQILIWQKTENTVTDISHARNGPRREDRKLTTAVQSFSVQDVSALLNGELQIVLMHFSLDKVIKL